ncbi:MAG: FimV/HubP family polar landmark protein, partial [Pseudomonadota bacterium]
MTRHFALIGVLAALGLPTAALALGLGEIRLNSALNQPLDAEIALIAPSSQELSVLSAEVAARETFERYGLDRPEFLNTFRVAVGRSADGSPVLRVTSTRPVPEPFVTFLVEADWEKGRLLREYTVLLDPPAFLPEDSNAPAAAVTAPRPSTSPSRPLSGNVVRPATPAPAPAARPAQNVRPLNPEPTGGVYGPVRRNENLWNIASRYRDSSVTMNQMMLAIYEANPEAFANNINHLKEGASLRIPDLSAARRIDRSQALVTAKTHNDAWRAGTPQVAGATPRGTAGGPSAPPSTGRDAGRLELVSPSELEGQLAQTNSRLEDTRRELDREQTRADRAEQALSTTRTELQEARRLLDVQDDRLAEMQSRLADAGAEVPEPVMPAEAPVSTDAGVDLTPVDEPAVDAEPVDATAAEAPAEPQPVAEAPAPTPSVVSPNRVVTSPEPSLLDTLKGLWLWLLLGAGAIAAAIGFVLFKRRQDEPAVALDDDVTDEVDAGATVLHERSNTEPVAMPAPEESVKYFEDTGTFKPVDFVPDENEDQVDPGPEPAIVPRPETAESGEYPFDDSMGADASLNLDQSDPLAEADFHMAYG